MEDILTLSILTQRVDSLISCLNKSAKNEKVYNQNLNTYLKVPVGTEFQQKPKLSVVQFAGARSHQVDQVEVVLQVCQDLHLAEERRQLRPVERVVDGLDGDLRHGAGIEKAFSLADVHAAEVATAQQLADLEF